jgi:hypothetical protein
MSGKKTLGSVMHPSQASRSGWVIPVLRESDFKKSGTSLELDLKTHDPDCLPIVIRESDELALGKILGRNLIDSDYRLIANMLKYARCIKDIATSENASHQDVIATLKAIAKADDNTIHNEFKNCDVDTHSLIDAALYCEMRIEIPSVHPPERIRAAAKVALYNVKNGRDGRPSLGYRELFAQEVWRIWIELGGIQDAKAWELDGDGSPLAMFTWHLLKMIEPETCPSLSNVVKLIRPFTK